MAKWSDFIEATDRMQHSIHSHEVIVVPTF